MTYRKKLIEVALPLEAINKESAREKSIRHGHPSTLHLWWSRKPLATCRAVLFASLVDDPSSRPEEFPTEEAQEQERQRLFRIIEELVKWENINNERVLNAARAEILKSTDGNPPPVYDPFCGGGSIPLEAQRLGLEAHGSDLNPVAVLITKALIEIPPKFKDMPPVNPESRQKLKVNQWKGAQGLAEDVRYYGKWMWDEAEKRIGQLYPKIKLPLEKGGSETTVIAWLWIRTVECPSPVCRTQMPLTSTFSLSTKKNNAVWVEPTIDRSQTPPAIRFEVKTGKGEVPDGTVSRRGGVCICCGAPVPFDYIRSKGEKKLLGAQLIGIVAEGKRERVYLSPTELHEEISKKAQAGWEPETELPEQALGFRIQRYGITKHADLFTSRQLTLLITFSSLVSEAHKQIKSDIEAVFHQKVDTLSQKDRYRELAYADAVATYLALGVSKLSDYNSTLAIWSPSRDQAKATFARQALPMVWNFTEVNPFAGAAGDLTVSLRGIAEVLERGVCMLQCGSSNQFDATNSFQEMRGTLISTDPPYYDAVPYADLSDFFYIWLRHAVGKLYPSLYSTLLVPKSRELLADPFRHKGRENAKLFFEKELGKAFKQMRGAANSGYPLTIYYAFKQAESDEENDENESGLTALSSTGWETMLEGLLKADFAISGTWPIRTERSARTRSIDSNALASSIVLVCRPRPENAPQATRRQLLNELQRELPDALKKLQQGNIAPVDLAQASIGPGMAIFSRYAKVLEADGSPMRVRTALQLINQTLDQFLSEQEGEFDGDSRWAIAWFEQHQFNDGLYGDAETLSKAKNTAVQGMVNAGILMAKGGKVRLLRRDELPDNWNPSDDDRVPDWEATQHLIRTLDQQGETGAANLLMRLGDKGEVARDLAYRLYSICERKNWTQEAMAYNSLVISYPEIARLASEVNQSTPQQLDLMS